MSSVDKLNIETFYKKLQSKFPQLQKLSVWTEWNWTNDSPEHSGVMSAIAEEMIKWARNGDWLKVTELLKEIEVGFTQGDERLVAYLGTDFTVTVTECRVQEDRERIKKLMGKVTFDAYQINLRGYREL